VVSYQNRRTRYLPCQRRLPGQKIRIPILQIHQRYLVHHSVEPRTPSLQNMPRTWTQPRHPKTSQSWILEHNQPTPRLRSLTHQNPCLEIVWTMNPTSYLKYRKRARSSHPRRTRTTVRKDRYTDRSNPSSSYRTNHHTIRNPSVNPRTPTTSHDYQDC
jgi:hypothetical protein